MTSVSESFLQPMWSCIAWSATLCSELHCSMHDTCYDFDTKHSARVQHSRWSVPWICPFQSMTTTVWIHQQKRLWAICFYSFFCRPEKCVLIGSWLDAYRCAWEPWYILASCPCNTSETCWISAHFGVRWMQDIFLALHCLQMKS